MKNKLCKINHTKWIRLGNTMFTEGQSDDDCSQLISDKNIGEEWYWRNEMTWVKFLGFKPSKKTGKMMCRCELDDGSIWLVHPSNLYDHEID